MYTADDFPGAGNIPWQLLIRARYAFEIDAVLASVVVARVGALTSVDVARKLVDAAGVKAGGDKAEPGAVLGALRATLDFDDWCGTNWPRRWPPKPRGRDFDDLSDPIVPLVAERALELLTAGGSPDLQGSLGQVLAEVGGIAH
ncbi:hypothetical protein [Nocardioides sp.]|uniref:hypothetical protein n=1 Tax=Nocardioides sp. TaxID=35761 RepID=UPI00271EEE29|nr:hypothetical protein [Nocardioides sp.]MDO9455195.1 hypothetical protein [Nocardioides sp.]